MTTTLTEYVEEILATAKHKIQPEQFDSIEDYDTVFAHLINADSNYLRDRLLHANENHSDYDLDQARKIGGFLISRLKEELKS